MICPACGAENREGARFCRQCRFELAPLVPAVAAAEALPPEPAPGPPAGEAVEAEPSGSKAEGGAPAGPPEAAPEAKVPVEHPEAEPEAGEPEGGPELEKPPEEPEVQVEEPLEQAARREPEAAVPPRAPAEEEGGEAPAAPGAEEDVTLFWREKSEPLVPLDPGTVVAERYRVLEALDVQPAQVLYQAEDLRACWQCGFEGNASEDAFCAQCGATLETRRQMRLLQVAAGQSPRDLPAGVEPSPLEHGGQVFFLLQEPLPPPEAARQDLRLVAGQRSDTGRIRELNEDSLLAVSLSPSYEGHAAPLLGLFAVADGMGGHEGGEVASKLALQVLAEHVLKGIVLAEMAGGPLPEEELLLRLEKGVAAANDAVYLARHKRGNDMGTTLTAALVRNDRLFLAHVGDCRAFRWNADGLEQLTTDHSVVASMIANGQAAPEEIYSHPHRSIIYRSIGDKPSLEIDTQVLPLAAGDRLVVCSDGLWEMVRNEGITDAMLQEADPQAACDLLVRHANLAGGEDNISIVVVAVEAMQA